jgi:hypothetical protein
MTGAGDALLEAAAVALRAVDGIGRVYDAPPLQAALPHAVVAIDAESDWSHKSGSGRALRLSASIRDKGERPERLRGLAGEAQAALAALGGDLPGWQLVTMRFLRTRTVRSAGGEWAASIEFQARLLAAG